MVTNRIQNKVAMEKVVFAKSVVICKRKNTGWFLGVFEWFQNILFQIAIF